MKGGYMKTRAAFKADQMQPPVKGWEFPDDGDKWQSVVARYMEDFAIS